MLWENKPSNLKLTNQILDVPKIPQSLPRHKVIKKSSVALIGQPTKCHNLILGTFHDSFYEIFDKINLFFSIIK